MNTTTLYVAIDGDDRWSGRGDTPLADGTDGPLRTLAAARDRLRSLRPTAPGPARVLVRGGIHFLADTLTFGPEDSGTPEAPVVYAAYPGEAPVISGGVPIRDWQQTQHQGRPCWIAALPQVASGEWRFTQLFFDNIRRPRPRLPKEGWHRFARLPEGATDQVQWMHGPDRVHFQPGQLSAAWKNPDDIKILVLQLWFEAHHRIRQIDEANSLIVFRAPSLGSLKDEKGELARFCAENVFEALNSPGEWYLDRPAGRLYYLPLPGEEPERLQVIAPRLQTLVQLQGAPAAPVHDIRLENLSFQHAEWDYPPEDPGSIQAAFKVPGAVVLEGAENCVLYGCEIARIAQYGIEVRAGSSGNRIVACAIHDMGAGGVRVDHESMDRSEATSPSGSGTAQRRPMATTIADCRIHDGALLHPSAIGVWIGNAGRNTILHNQIFNLNYTGISCGWTWGYAPTATVANRIEYNHIHHINTARVLSDNGGIYTLGTQPGTVLRGNLIHDIGCYHYGGWGIYPDEGSSEILIEDNLVYRTDGAGFSTHYGRDNWVRNNLFALSARDHLNPGKREQHRTTLFERNIALWRQGCLREREWPLEHYLFRKNLLWPGQEGLDLGEGIDLAALQARGQHLDTLIADPLCADPDGGDFALRADSPARRIGFRPFDPAKAGPRDRGTRPASYDAWPFADDRPLELVRTRFEPLGDNRYRVVVENSGDLPSSGRLRLEVLPKKRARLQGTVRLEFADLAPGETRSAEFALVKREDSGPVCVAAVPRGRGLHPATFIAP